MKHITYQPKGVCSRGIEIDLTDDGIIESVTFIGGCAGNTKGVAALARGLTAEEAVKRLSGIHCGMKGTSCPDQLAKALQEALTA